MKTTGILPRAKGRTMHRPVGSNPEDFGLAAEIPAFSRDGSSTAEFAVVVPRAHHERPAENAVSRVATAIKESRQVIDEWLTIYSGLRFRRASFAESAIVTIAAPSMMASLTTNRPAPDRSGNPCFGAAQRRDPAFGGRKQERQGRERHAHDEEAAQCRDAREPRIHGDHHAQADDDGPEAVGERIGPVPFVPIPVGGDQVSLPVRVPAVFPGGLPVEEAHRGAVGHEGDDSLVLVAVQLEAADPDEHQDQPDAGQDHPEPIQARGQF